MAGEAEARSEGGDPQRATALSALVDQRLGGLDAGLDAGLRDALSLEVDALLGSIAGRPRGVDLATVPAFLVDDLHELGLPLAPGGELRWGHDIMVCDVSRPVLDAQGNLLMPPIAELMQLSSLALRPVRGFIGTRLGVRLQTAAGVALHLFDDAALLISRREVPLGGFLYGPHPGQRHGVSLQPGSHQLITW
ncbi:MAG: hypothetical protein ACOCYP_07940 [Planctomycetota bacterium]